MSEDIYQPQNTSQTYRVNITVRGTPCPKPNVTSCNAGCCPVNCKSTPISNPKCNVTCGGGWKHNYNIIQHRECSGAACEGNEWEKCYTECDCEVEWQGWSACSEDCGPGTRTRTYTITQDPTPGGEACPDYKEDCKEDDCVSVAGPIAGGQLLKSKIIVHLFFIRIHRPTGLCRRRRRRNILFFQNP